MQTKVDEHLKMAEKRVRYFLEKRFASNSLLELEQAYEIVRQQGLSKSHEIDRSKALFLLCLVEITNRLLASNSLNARSRRNLLSRLQNVPEVLDVMFELVTWNHFSQHPAVKRLILASPVGADSRIPDMIMMDYLDNEIWVECTRASKPRQNSTEIASKVVSLAQKKSSSLSQCARPLLVTICIEGFVSNFQQSTWDEIASSLKGTWSQFRALSAVMVTTTSVIEISENDGTTTYGVSPNVLCLPNPEAAFPISDSMRSLLMGKPFTTSTQWP